MERNKQPFLKWKFQGGRIVPKYPWNGNSKGVCVFGEGRGVII